MPECQINVSSAVRVDDFIELQCKVNYSGDWIPHFLCFKQHHDGQHQTPIPSTGSKSCHMYNRSFSRVWGIIALLFQTNVIFVYLQYYFVAYRTLFAVIRTHALNI